MSMDAKTHKLLTTWQPADSLAEHLNLHASTVYRASLGDTQVPQWAGKIERKPATSADRRALGVGVRWLLRVQPEALVAPRPERITHASPTRREPDERRDVVISWERFAVVHEGVEYLSLRKMVEEGGLYAHFHKAKAALERSDVLVFTRLVEKSGGRPKEDLLLLPHDAQRFAAQAGTEVGRQIAEVIVAHHNEYQAIRAGDVEATAHAVGGNSFDALRAMIDQMEQQQNAIRRHESALADRPTRAEVVEMVGAVAATTATLSLEEEREVWRRIHDSNVSIVAKAVPEVDRIDVDDDGDSVVVQANRWVNRQLKRALRRAKAEWTRVDYKTAWHILYALAVRYGVNDAEITPLPTAGREQLQLTWDA